MKLRPFEVALVAIFAALLLSTLLILKFFQPGSNSGDDEVATIGVVSIWGVLPPEAIDRLLSELSTVDDSYRGVSYTYIQPADFDSTLVAALADNAGPDLILISQEELVKTRKRIEPITYENFSLRDFRDLYLEGFEVFALSDGIYSYPLAVDPLMLYWNRDILTTEGYLAAPKSWEQLVNDMFPTLIARDYDRTIIRSVVALGEYSNVRNAFGILSALITQQGAKGVVEQDNKYMIQLDQSSASGKPLAATVDFYTRFSRPSNALYSWNRSLPEDRLQFTGENLVFYFGYGSEASQLERLNPNLNFDIAEIPQGEAATVRRTYGKFYGLSLLTTSDNIPGATMIMQQLGGTTSIEKIAEESGVVPAFRDVVANGNSGKYSRATYQSASIARGWLNPSLAETEKYFDTMVRDINENRRDTPGAVADFLTRVREEYK